jgi:hypothetical protein
MTKHARTVKPSGSNRPSGEKSSYSEQIEVSSSGKAFRSMRDVLFAPVSPGASESIKSAKAKE